MRRVLITVTQDDIDKGRESIRKAAFRCQTCPVARAVIRAFPDIPSSQVAVGPDDARLGYGGEIMKLSKRATQFILDFDRELEEVKPFKFYGVITTLAERSHA